MPATVIVPTEFDPIEDQPVLSGISGNTDNANGNKFRNPRGTLLYLYNPTGGSITATVVAARATIRPLNGLYGELPNASEPHAVPAGGILEIACPPGRFNDADGNVTVTYSGAGLKALVLKEDS